MRCNVQIKQAAESKLSMNPSRAVPPKMDPDGHRLTPEHWRAHVSPLWLTSARRETQAGSAGLATCAAETWVGSIAHGQGTTAVER